jgi:hypothetical protein
MSMLIKDHIHVSDSGAVKVGGVERRWGDEKSVVEVKGWVDLVCRERGKIVPGTRRRGFNIWTNTGREFVSQRISIDLATRANTIRTDAVTYLGVGKGTQLEEPGVLRLDQAVVYDQDVFLAEIGSIEFPAFPVRTMVEFRRIFGENEITTAGITVAVSELGLFTNGDPKAIPSNAFGSRDSKRSLADAWDAAPVAYKTFEPVSKTAQMQLEVAWQIRF